VEPKKRKVTIYSFDVSKETETDLKFTAEVSKGTYLRSLASDFGDRLGTYGYLASLRRTSSGDFHVNDALTLDQLDQMTPEALIEKVITQYAIRNT
jgi:tRNA pseudouridine55 synthase